MQQRTWKTLVLWVVLGGLFVLLYAVGGPPRRVVSFESFLGDLQDERVLSVRLQPTSDGDRAALTVDLKDASPYTTAEVPLRAAMEAVVGAQVEYHLEQSPFSVSGVMVAQWVPLGVLVLLMWFFFRQLKGLSGGKNPGLAQMTSDRLEVTAAPQLDPRTPTPADSRLLDAVRALKDGRPGPRKVLLTGPTGAGKTTLVRHAVAVAGVRWLPVAASDVPNVFVGLASARVRRVFELAASNVPCVVLLEDLDALASRRREPGDGTAREEGQLTEAVQGMLELCQVLDGFRPFPDGVLVVSTTNRPDRLDEAITRPGRVDLRIDLPPRA